MAKVQAVAGTIGAAAIIKIGYAAIEEQAEALATSARNLENIANNVKIISDIISHNNDWYSPSSEAYARQLKANAAELEKLSKRMKKAFLYVVSITNGYKQVDQKVINSILNSLDLRKR